MKVEKSNVVKEIEDRLLSDYLTAGWKIAKENKEIKKQENKETK